MDPAIAPPPPPPVAGADGHARVPAGTHEHTGRQRWGRVAGLAAAIGVTAYVGLVDPSAGGAYPLCPSQVLFGIDCPACGGLRGTHDLLNGDIVGALDHNLLLPVFLVLYGAALALWLRPLIGRPARPVRLPRWALVAGVAVAVGFTVLRNLPVTGLEFLASGT